MAKKGNRINVILQCTEAKEAGFPPSRYVSSKNRKNTPGRIEMQKYNPFMRKHTLHREIK
ncbi:MAG: 50S ribosomal protein L33 [Acidobacteria bacterium]|nr:50S ribosomal protein L33 [Acidobacteriota bacterium]